MEKRPNILTKEALSRYDATECPGQPFLWLTPEKARGRGHCQAVRRLAARFWEGWISWARCWGSATADAAFSFVLPTKSLSVGSVGSSL